jgi:autophagy-related protein 11
VRSEIYKSLCLLINVFSHSAGERKRRQSYRSEFLGQLPFDLKGMDEPVPAIDFSPSGSSDGGQYGLERSDVKGE